MHFYLNIVLSLSAAAMLIPVAVLCLECLAALLPDRDKKRTLKSHRPRVAVLVPAHNEEGVVGGTLQTIVPQLIAGDRVIVVADNCTDRTAEEAGQAGAVVVVREDTTRIGKGYALDVGLCQLRSDPPEVVIIVDADCYVHEGTVDALARNAVLGRPVQGLDLLFPREMQAKQALSSLAFLLKNQIRPTGLSRLGLPCLLAGTGMAFPWEIISAAPLAHGNIVEDMQLGIDLAIQGKPARFCPDAKVTGLLPSSENAAATQRTRWEHGHLRTILTQVPRLLRNAIRQRRLDLLVLALDISVPPLSLLLVLQTVLSMLAGGAVLATASPLPAFLCMMSWLVLIASILGIWWKFARDSIPAWVLLTIPIYVLAKLPIYAKFAFRPQTVWVRTERNAKV